MSKKKVPDGTPSNRELKKSGTKAWVDDAVREQERKNRELSSILEGDSEKLRSEKDALAGILNMDNLPEPEAGPAAPDLFAAEREAGRAAKAGLAGMFGDEQRRAQEEKDQLLGMFGFSAEPKKKKR